MPKDPEARKAASIAKLQAENIPAIDWLPVIESADEARIRRAEEIARRAIACLIAIQAACEQNEGNYDDEGAAWCHGLLEQYNVADEITANERAILAKQGSEQDIINMVWKYEAYWTLLWALGIVEKLDYPDHIVDCQFAIEPWQAARTLPTSWRKPACATSKKSSTKPTSTATTGLAWTRASTGARCRAACSKASSWNAMPG